MGISTLQSYRGAQVFEAIGLNKSLIDKYLTGTASRIEGVGLDVLAREAQMKHALAFRPVTGYDTELPVGGNYQYRVRGEYHLLNPLTVEQTAARRAPAEPADLSGIHGPDRQAEPAALYPARPARNQEGGATRFPSKTSSRQWKL